MTAKQFRKYMKKDIKRRSSKYKKMTDKEQTAMIKKLEKQVKANTEIFETKYLDLTTTVLPFISNLNGTFYNLNDIKPFDTTSATSNLDRISQRVGHKVTSSSINVKGIIQLPYSDPTANRDVTPTRVRLMYVQILDLGVNNNLVATDFLDKPALPFNLVDGFVKRNRTTKLKILKDVTYTLEPNYWRWQDAVQASNIQISSGYTSTHPSNIKFNHYLTKYNKNLEWDPLSATATTPIMGSIVLYVITDTAQAVELSFHSRHVFKDQ